MNVNRGKGSEWADRLFILVGSEPQLTHLKTRCSNNKIDNLGPGASPLLPVLPET